MKNWVVNGKVLTFIGDAEAEVYAALDAERLQKYLDKNKLRKEIRGVLCDMAAGDVHDFLGVIIEVPHSEVS